jgi:uncharacterized membrane protein YjgN (DUF898 family)
MRWCYALHNERHGPVEEATLRDLLNAGTITAATLVWREGMPDWRPLGDMDLGAPPPPDSPRGPAGIEPAESREVPVVFTGTTGEYFRIWIVNLGLTVLTLGIYAAWAKVRKRRYFYGNTMVEGKPFEYTGNPIAILKGNLLIGGVMLAYFASSLLFPPLGIIFVILFAATFPWLYYQALRFNAHNTRHRNIRFHFHGTPNESYIINLVLPMLLPFTLGVVWPYIQFRKRQYQLGSLSYGAARFRFSGGLGRFYEFFFKAGGLFLLAILVAGLIIGAIFGATGGFDAGEAGRLPTALIVAPFITYGIVLLILPAYYLTRCTNYSVGCTDVENLATLRSSMRVREILWLEFTNLLAIVASLGLAIPWAAIRRARYRFSHLHVHLSGSLDQVAATMEASQSAIGDSAADVLDFDIAL